jgi:hypothetical protein
MISFLDNKNSTFKAFWGFFSEKISQWNFMGNLFVYTEKACTDKRDQKMKMKTKKCFYLKG